MNHSIYTDWYVNKPSVRDLMVGFQGTVVTEESKILDGWNITCDGHEGE